MKTARDCQNVFEWLDLVREHPGMYIGDLNERALYVLENLVHGYSTALAVHSVDEHVPDTDHFSAWLGFRTGWSMSCGWAFAIIDNARPVSPLETFFKWIDEFRKLQPTLVCSVTTTGQPDRVDLIRYVPEPLFYLRLCFASRFERGRILWDNGREIRSRDLAVQWVQREMGIPSTEWREPLNCALQTDKAAQGTS
jgi:hypothetical protein